MDFIANSEIQNREMLAEIGIKSVSELFKSIPQELLIPPPTQNDGLSEYEGLRKIEEIASKNHYHTFDNYLGAGAYEHHVPAIVSAICSKSEFLTSYTAYQAEASQGMLQAIFEFQSAICAFTGLDVANASLYDGASACAEALLMALRLQHRECVIVAANLHPHYQAVIQQYLLGYTIQWAPFLPNGQLDTNRIEALCNEKTAAILLQYPNFFGGIDQVKPIAEIAKKQEALTIISGNPLAYGLYASPAENGADIAVGDCQPFGIPLQFGGPYAGYIACRQDLVRQLPGRIVGETVDGQGRKGYVLTLQTREQHIRREKATSNICTNQALAALASLIAILWYGKEGIHKLALTNYQRAAYLKDHLQRIGYSSMDVPFFNEFPIKFNRPVKEIQARFRAHNIEPGVDLDRFFPQFENYLLVAVTETKSKAQLDSYLSIAKELL